MATSSDVLKIAANEVGYSRWNDPLPGTKYGRWYAELTNSSYFGTSGVPFCAMFVSWVLNKAGVKCNYFPKAVAFDKSDRNELGSAYVDKYNLKPGDVISFDWDGDDGGDHVGFVEKVYSNYVSTIEGNTDNGIVARKTRYYSSIICGVRPNYSSSPSNSATGNSLVKQGQQYLVNHGFSVGSSGIDGYYGQDTRAGLIKFVQTQLNKYGAGLAVDGLNGPLTKRAWEKYGPVYYNVNKWSLVLAVQTALLCHGYSVGSSGIDGYCGNDTNNAIKSFQKDYNLDVDGYVGPATFSKLF